MSTYSVTQLLDIETNKVLAEAWFDLGAPLRSLSASWNWVQDYMVAEHGCTEDEVECDEPDEDDEFGHDYVTVGGKRVARINHRFPQGAEIAKRVFAEAAE